MIYNTSIRAAISCPPKGCREWGFTKPRKPLGLILFFGGIGTVFVVEAGRFAMWWAQ